jgi:hypothetical protein
MKQWAKLNSIEDLEKCTSVIKKLTGKEYFIGLIEDKAYVIINGEAKQIGVEEVSAYLEISVLDVIDIFVSNGIAIDIIKQAQAQDVAQDIEVVEQDVDIDVVAQEIINDTIEIEQAQEIINDTIEIEQAQDVDVDVDVDATLSISNDIEIPNAIEEDIIVEEIPNAVEDVEVCELDIKEEFINIVLELSKLKLEIEKLEDEKKTLHEKLEALAWKNRK